MQDLVNKIEELRKALSAMKPKQPSLVPALKPPTVKPLSMPSVSAGSAPTKLPGVAPASGKDPKKMAEQLKNPRPKKPKIEMLKYDANGQWRLDKEDHYRIHVDGQPVTGAMPLKTLTTQHGPVKHIESNPANKIVPIKKFGEQNSV